MLHFCPCSISCRPRVSVKALQALLAGWFFGGLDANLVSRGTEWTRWVKRCEQRRIGLVVSPWGSGRGLLGAGHVQVLHYQKGCRVCLSLARVWSSHKMVLRPQERAVLEPTPASSYLSILANHIIPLWNYPWHGFCLHGVSCVELATKPYRIDVRQLRGSSPAEVCRKALVRDLLLRNNTSLRNPNSLFIKQRVGIHFKEGIQ